jgi:hypothetical protein
LVLDQNPDWLLDDSWVIVQIDPMEYENQALDNLVLFDRRTYGNTQLVFYMVGDGDQKPLDSG